jgi:hypothetical protein
MHIETDYPKSGFVVVTVTPPAPEKFSVRLRIPAWSKQTTLKVNGKLVKTVSGSYAEIRRKWAPGDRIELALDMRCRLLESPHGSNRAADNQQALVRGPVVLARDENIDPDYDKPVMIAATNGHVEVVAVPPTLPGTRMQFRVPTQDGFIQMVDYASVDNWNGKHVRTWLPRPAAGNRPQ